MNTITDMKTDETAIRDLLEHVVTAFNKSDLEELLSFHSDDIILMEPNMPVIKGKDQVRKLFAAFQQKKIEMELDFDIVELEVNGDRAFVRGHVLKTVLQNGSITENDTGKFICLLKKQADGTWLRTHVIVNSDQPAKILN